MMLKRALLPVILGLALLTIGVVMAQTPSATPNEHEHPAATASPAAMPMRGGMSGSMMQMMPPPKSAADRGYMGAMMQMHGGMMRMTMTGNADHDFVVMMIPHHQAAIAMAQTELQYGSDPKIKALAKRIIAAQQAEIKEMQSWLK